MKPHQLPTGPALVQVAVLLLGATAASTASADPPEDSSKPELRRLPYPQFTLEDERVRIVISDRVTMSRQTAVQQTLVALRTWMKDVPVLLPTGALEERVVREIGADVPVTILDDDRFTVSREWWDTTVAQLSRREQVGHYHVAEGFIGDVRIVSAPPGMQHLLGKRVLTFSGQDVDSLDDMKRIHQRKEGVVGAPVVLENGVTTDLSIAPPIPPDIIRKAPTCGPCCHGSPSCDRGLYMPGGGL